MSIFQDFKKSLKMMEVEEVLDLIIYRPIAFAFVTLIYRTPVSPNFVTFLSLVTGLISGYYYTRATAPAFVVGGIWLAVANVLDCSDGQLARMQSSGTPFGRLADGIADWVISIAILTGLGIGLTNASGNAGAWFLVVAAGISAAVHALVFDFVQQEYLSGARGEKHSVLRELDKVDAEMSQPGFSSPLAIRRVGLGIYRLYLSLQRFALLGSAPRVPVSPEDFREMHVRSMRSWTLLGSTTNRTLLIAASLMGYPEAYCWIVVIPGNLYLAVRLVARYRQSRARESRPVARP